MSDVKNSLIWTYSGFFLRALLGFAAAPIMVSRIGTIGYGVFLSLSLYSYNGVFQLLDFGIPLFIQREYSAADEKTRRTFFRLHITIIVISLIPTCISLFFLYEKLEALGEFSFFSLYSSYVLMALNIFLGIAVTYPNTRLICEGNLSLVKKNEVFQSILWVVTGCVVVLLSKRFIEPFLIITIISQLLAFVFLIKKIKGSSNFLYPSYRLVSLFQELAPDLKRTLVSSLLLKLNGFTFKQSDSLIVSVFLGPRELAILDICLKFLSFFKVMLGKINEVIFVSFSRGFETKNNEGIPDVFGRILNVLVIASLSCSIFIFSFSDQLLQLMLKDNTNKEYSWFVKLSSLVVLTLPFAHTVPSYLMAVEKKVSETVKLITIVSIFNLCSTLYLVTVMKIEGVIISTLIQQVILGSLLFKRCRFNENQKSVIQKNFYISFALILFPLIFLKLGILGSVGLLLVLLIIIFNICMVLRNDTIHEVQSILRK